MRFSLHFHEFLIILSTNIFFQNIRRYISDISNISPIYPIYLRYIRYIRNYRYFHPGLNCSKISDAPFFALTLKSFLPLFLKPNTFRRVDLSLNVLVFIRCMFPQFLIYAETPYSPTQSLLYSRVWMLYLCACRWLFTPASMALQGQYRH